LSIRDVGTWNEKGIGLHSADYITLLLWKIDRSGNIGLAWATSG